MIANPLLILLLLSPLYLLVLSSPEPRQNCVLGPDGKMQCVLLSPISPAVRIEGRAPCARDDVKCWCEKAKDYTNDVRKKNGVSKMLKLGSKSQMDNAMRYAKKLARMGYLKHQDLSAVTKEVGCQRWMGGENLAFNYETGDVAKMCVKQWIDSKAHFDNLVRDWFEEVVVGFHFESDGRVYCVQTFALPYPRGTFGSPTDRGCSLMSGPTPASAAAAAPTPAPSPSPAPTRAAPSPSVSPVPRRATSPMGTKAPLSCRCIKYGRGCKVAVAQKAGDGCKEFTQRSKQALSCKMNCCDFCKTYPGVDECRHKHVKRICGTV